MSYSPTVLQNAELLPELKPSFPSLL